MLGPSGRSARGRLHDERTYRKDAKLAVRRFMRESVPTAESSGAAFIVRHISFVRLIQATSQTEENKQTKRWICKKTSEERRIKPSTW